MEHILDNPAWNALNSGNRHLANGNDMVKYFDKEVSPFVGMVANTPDNFKELHNVIPHIGPVGCISPLEAEIPTQWKVLQYIKCAQMVYTGDTKPQDAQIKLTELTTAHVPQMLALTKLTNPGPFAPRTIEFGHYRGVFNGDKLVAMAGQRLNPFNYAEVSAVCTHPDHLGNGYARQLLTYQANRIIAAGNTPFLHVRHDNDRAIKVYHHSGFEIRTHVHFYILQKV